MKPAKPEARGLVMHSNHKISGGRFIVNIKNSFRLQEMSSMSCNQHRVPVAEETIALRYGMTVCTQHTFPPGKGAYQHDKR